MLSLLYMGRKSRNSILTDGCMTHKTWHAHNQEFNLDKNIDKHDYLSLLFKKISGITCSIHAYAIMGNHAHELYTVNKVPLFSDFMRIHHTLYGQQFNKRNGRKGKVANERPTTTLIKNEAHEIISTLYIHANIFQIQKYKNPEEYQWSTHLLYAHGIRDSFSSKVILPNWYLNLGGTDSERQVYYRSMFLAYLQEPNELVSEIYKNTRTLSF